MKKMIFIFTMLMMVVCSCAFAASYPATLENGKLVFVATAKDVGVYADRSSAFIEVYTPQYYQVSIKTVVVKDGKTDKANVMTHHFQYDINTQRVKYLSVEKHAWETWDVNQNYGKDGGEQAVFNLAEVAFVSVCDRKYFGDMERTVSGKKQKVIPETLYQALGI